MTNPTTETATLLPVHHEPARVNPVSATLALMRWTLARQRTYIPLVVIIQTALAFSLIYGIALMMGQVGTNAATFLSSGTVTVNIISFGCVFAPQLIAILKTNGLFDYQRSLPVPRLSILCADILMWTVMALPGIISGLLAAKLRFNINIHLNPGAIAVAMGLQLAMTIMGFMLAYWVPENLLSIITQLIMYLVLLFSPITYPADHLPDWYVRVQEYLPFVPAANILRATLFDYGNFGTGDVLVVCAWAALAFAAALRALTRRN